LKSVELARGI